MSFDSSAGESSSYDDRDRITEYCTSWDDLNWTCTSTVYDDAGRVAWRTSQQNDDELMVIEMNDYSCAR